MWGAEWTVINAWFEASLLRQALPGPSKRYIRWWQRAFGLVLTYYNSVTTVALAIMLQRAGG